VKFLREFFARFRKPKGIALIPGESLTVRAGKLRLPLIDWEKLYRKSFLYNSLASVICGYFTAELLVACLTPYFPPTEAPRARATTFSQRDFVAYSVVIMPNRRANLFNKDGKIPNNDSGQDNRTGDPVKTNLPLTLLGVIVIQDASKSVASIEDKGSNQVIAVRVGENITNAAVVESISESQVVFYNQDTQRMEFVELPPDAAGGPRRIAPVVEGKKLMPGVEMEREGVIKISKPALEKALGEDFGKILTQALCTQEMNNGKPAGFRCSQIEKGSPYDIIGLKDGDVITAIDGEPLLDPVNAIGKLQAVKEGKARGVGFTILRGGATQTLQLNVGD
jgi:type II secretion system protein C